MIIIFYITLNHHEKMETNTSTSVLGKRLERLHQCLMRERERECVCVRERERVSECVRERVSE